MEFQTKALVAAALFSLPLASQEAGSRWKFSGFGTVGLAKSSTDQAEYSREFSQPRGVSNALDAQLDSRLGLQVNLNLTDDLSFVGQTVSKYRFDHTFTPDLSWAFLSYAPTSGLQIRAGRLGWDVFQLSDTRNVGYSNLWVRPPVDFYGVLQISSTDGMDIAWTTPIGEGQSLRFKVSAGQAWEKVPANLDGTNLDLKGGKLIGSLAEFQGETLNVRVGYTRLHTAQDFPAAMTSLRTAVNGFAALLNDPALARQADAMVFKDQVFHYYSAGLNWQDGPYRVDLVGGQVTSSSGLVPTLKSIYGSVGYRMGTVVPYLLASHLVTDQPAPYVGALPSLGPQGAGVAEGITAFVAHSHANQSTMAVGLRWDFHPSAALKAQVDRVSSQTNATMLWLNPKSGWDGKATVATVVLDFVF